MPTGSLLDDYLKAKVPGYKPGSLSPDTLAFAAAIDRVARVLPDVAESILQSCATSAAIEADRQREFRVARGAARDG